MSGTEIDMPKAKAIEAFKVDAFTDVPFGGNPAGVVPQATGLARRCSSNKPTSSTGPASSAWK